MFVIVTAGAFPPRAAFGRFWSLVGVKIDG